MRQKYQILVEDKSGVWRELELGGDKFAWTYQVNDIADLISRNASYSQALKIPRTARNTAIFDFANCFDAVTNNPYRRHNCRVYCADRTIAGKGSFLVILKITEYIECQILAGNASFFELLQESPMSDLDLGEFRITNRQMNPDTWHPAYKIAYGSDVALTSYPYQNEISRYVMYLRGVGAKYPVISVDYILQDILSRHGYTFESNVDYWKKMYLSIDSAEAEATAEDLHAFDGQVHTHGWAPVSGELPRVQFQWVIDNDADQNISINSYLDNVITYWTALGQTVRFTITSSTAGTPSDPKVIWIYIKFADEVKYENFILFGGASSELVWEYENELNSIVPLDVRAFSDDEPISGMGLTVKIEVIKAGTSENAGGKLVLSERTGFETQFDFIKFFAQAFGLTLVVDEVSKKIHAYTLDLLYDNMKAGKVIDWSGKVERDPGSSFSFTLKDYARENIITLEENSKDEYTDSVKLQIDNQTLKHSKELLKIGIGSGKDVMVDNLKGVEEIAASIPLIEVKPLSGDEDENPYTNGYEYCLYNASFPTTKPHLVELTDRTVPVSVTIRSAVSTYDYHIANHVTAQRIFEMGYAILQDRMLKHAKWIEDKFYLTPEDVEKFDPSIPVFIEKYGAYFYVNKIKNFELEKLTSCELIKL
jgi:hypothetical protein